MSLAKLTSLSTQTLSLLLERQRLQTMSQPPPAITTQHIVRNLDQLRIGILEFEAKESERSEASGLLRNQFTRMRDMLGRDGESVESLPDRVKETQETRTASSSSLPQTSSQKHLPYVPYSDEPPPSPDKDFEPSEVLQQQRLLMDEQDAHLDHLSLSVGRQRDISLQINDELEVHTGLLDEFDHGLDNTHNRLGGARRRLESFGRGVKGNLSTYIIAALILILLILIIIFKT
ncbi:hypothetical protein EW145_g3684 [Phellinidium pouzarii]|uniref:t-SNARE coiled-coil homology domain-containing protein n=1 Tax=Phellinidium pouzarii TaxID=167371 RepID=A0A4S4L6G6_9AGAM|nr:hypothetical protein EW145_g3684 [Phellinidium pouzarii]